MGIDVCWVVYVMLYMVWDVLSGVIGVVYVCGGGRWWVPMERGRQEWAGEAL